MGWKVLITRKILEDAIRLLEQEAEVELNSTGRMLTREELLNAVRGKDGILCLLTDKIDSEVMEVAGRQLKVIANHAVGYDNIDVEEASRRGIVVTNTPEVLTETTADFTWALILGIARRLAEADRFTRDGKFHGWDPLMLLGRDVYGKTLGIVGFGRIGQAVARRASGFQMKVLVCHPRREIKSPGANPVSFQELLKESDFVTIHTPLTPETHHLIGEKELRQMKPSAYLINTARGPVVEEKALARALKEGWIAGAALDVYEAEPVVHPGLLKLPNVILAPHIASASLETRTRMALMAAENLLAVLKGQAPPNAVNTEMVRKFC